MCDFNNFIILSFERILVLIFKHIILFVHEILYSMSFGDLAEWD